MKYTNSSGDNIVTGNSEFIRQINRSLIIKTIMEQKSISRSSIASQTTLALPTVMRITDSLLEEGIVVESGKGISSGGRNPVMVQMNDQAMYFIGVSVLRTLYVVLADISGNTLARYKSNTRSGHTKTELLHQILEGINYVVGTTGIDINKVASIGIGIPGTKFKEDPNLKNYPFYNWADFDLSEWETGGYFPCPVVFENVSKLGALGELMFGTGKNYNHFIYIYADQGIGAGIISNGKLLTGKNGVAGEFGHSVIEKNGLPCYCGNRGCLEMYCSTNSIINRLLEDEKTELSLKDQLTRLKDFIIVTAAACDGDELALLYLKESAQNLGLGLASLINLLNPELIIIGGELSENYPEYSKIVEQTARESIFRHLAQEVEIRDGGLGCEASVRGAVGLAMAKVFHHVQID